MPLKEAPGARRSPDGLKRSHHGYLNHESSKSVKKIVMVFTKKNLPEDYFAHLPRSRYDVKLCGGVINSLGLEFWHQPAKGLKDHLKIVKFYPKSYHKKLVSVWGDCSLSTMGFIILNHHLRGRCFFSNHHFQANLRLATKGLEKELKDHLNIWVFP